MSFVVPPPPEVKKRFPWWRILVAVVVLALIAGLVLFVVTRDRGAPVAARPVNTARPTVSGVPNVGQVLSAGDGVWQGDGITFTHEDLAVGAQVRPGTPIVLRAPRQLSALQCGIRRPR